MDAAWPEMDELRRLLGAGYRPSDELLALIRRIAAEGDLAVDRIEIDHDERRIQFVWETAPTFCETTAKRIDRPPGGYGS